MNSAAALVQYLVDLVLTSNYLLALTGFAEVEIVSSGVLPRSIEFFVVLRVD